MALTPEQEQEMIQIELELRNREAQKPKEPEKGFIDKGIESVTQNPAYAENPMVGALRLRNELHRETDIGADEISKGLKENGTNDKLADAVGKAFKLLPDALEVVGTGFGATKAAQVGIKAAAESGLGKAIRYTGEKEAAKLASEKAAIEVAESTTLGGIKTAAERVGGMAKKATEEATQAAQAPIIKIKETIKELPILKRKVLEGANAAKLEAKAAIGQAEKELGIDLATLGTEASDAMIKKPQAFISKFGQIANRVSPEKLAESVDAKSLQVVRKAAERGASAARKLGQDAAEFYRIESHFREAIARGNDNFRVAISRFKDASEALKTLPNDFKAKSESLASGLQKMQTMAKEKVMTDAKVIRLNRAAEILERKAKELPRAYATQKAKIDLAIQEARNLAQKQAHTRWLAGGGAVAAGAALLGRKAVNLVTGGQ